MREKQWNKPEDNIDENPKDETQEEQFSETLDFNRPDFSFVPKGTHIWRQQGPVILCKSCELQHAVHIGINKRLMGFDKNGQPIIQEVKF